MKANITDADWNFKDIVEFLDYQNDIMMPDWKKESQWRQFVPKGATYMDFIHWWMAWRRLGQDCDLREVDWNHQFNACMNHNGYFTKLLQDMIEAELCDTEKWSVDRKYKFMAGKLMIAYKAQQTLRSVESNSTEKESKTLVCFGCGLQGHVRSQCPREGSPKKDVCYNCGQQGHFASACPRERRQGQWSNPPAHVAKGHVPHTHVSNTQERVGGGSSKGYAKRSNSAPPSGFGGRGHQQGKGSQQAQHVGAQALPLTREEVQRRKDLDLCLHCGRSGHYSRECPVKKSMPDRKGASQRHVKAFDKSSKGSGAKGTPKGMAKGRGKPSGKGKGHGAIRELDAHEHEDYHGEEQSWEEEQEA